MSANYQIVMPVSAFFCVPFIRENIFRMFDGERDITPDVDHGANRDACRMTNEHNAVMAKRFDITPPYYHYDALSGKALKIDPPSPHHLHEQQREKPEEG